MKRRGRRGRGKGGIMMEVGDEGGKHGGKTIEKGH